MRYGGNVDCDEKVTMDICRGEKIIEYDPIRAR